MFQPSVVAIFEGYILHRTPE